jgi:hypothetical protein
MGLECGKMEQKEWLQNSEGKYLLENGHVEDLEKSGSEILWYDNGRCKNVNQIYVQTLSSTLTILNIQVLIPDEK